MVVEHLSKMESSDLMTSMAGYPETFQAVQKISRLSGNFPGYPETFQAIQKLSRLSRNFPGYPETCQAIQKLYGSSISRVLGNFPDHPENIQIIQKLSRLSGNFPDNSENIQTIRKFSKGPRNSPLQFQGLRAKTFWTRKNLPDGNASLLPRFLGLWPKLFWISCARFVRHERLLASAVMQKQSFAICISHLYSQLDFTSSWRKELGWIIGCGFISMLFQHDKGYYSYQSTDVLMDMRYLCKWQFATAVHCWKLSSTMQHKALCGFWKLMKSAVLTFSPSYPLQ